MDTKTKANSEQQPAKGKPSSGAVQGEGDYASARTFQKHERDFVESGQVDQKAREAEKAYEGKEGDELRRAEEQGKRHSHGEDPLLNKKK